MKKIFLLTSVIFLAFSLSVFSQNSPSNPSTSNPTNNSVNLIWTDNDCTPLGPDFIVHYRILNSGAPWTNAGPGFFPNDPLTGLVASTDYEWRVKCNGAGGPGAWTPLDTFTTLAVTFGCTNALACNYDATANTDDGSCELPDGCTDATATNYDATALCDDGSCIYTVPVIDTAFITYPILCNGIVSDSLEIQITQTNPAMPYKCIVGTYFNNTLFFTQFIQTASTISQEHS